MIYGCSLLAVLFLAYLLFSTPSRITRGQLTKYTEMKAQHDALLGKTDSVTASLVDLMQVEKLAENSSDPAVDSLVEEYHGRIFRAVENIRRDSANNSFSLLNGELTNYLTAYNAILLSPGKPVNLQRLEPIAKPQVQENLPTNLQELRNNLQTALQQNQLAVQQNTDLKEHIKKQNEKIAKLSVTGTTPPIVPSSGNSAKELQDLQNQLSNRNADVAKLNARIKELEDRPVNTGGAEMTAAEKAAVKFQIVDQMITGGMSRGDAAKGICAEARRIMQEIKGNVANKAAYDQTMAKMRRFCEVQ